jgi:hypothetical protein
MPSSAPSPKRHEKRTTPRITDPAAPRPNEMGALLQARDPRPLVLAEMWPRVLAAAASCAAERRSRMWID